MLLQSELTGSCIMFSIYIIEPGIDAASRLANW